MKIIITFVLKNMREKKFRTFLILFSIILSSALFLASMAISNTMESMYVNRMKKYYGNSDIIMAAGENASSSFFRTAITEGFHDQLTYAVGAVDSSALYKPERNETVQISLKGFLLKDLQMMNPVVLSQLLDDESFTGRKIIISRVMANKYGLESGDRIDLEINGVTRKFQIAALAESMGPFQEDGRNVMAIVPLNTLNSIYNARGKVSILYMKLKDPAALQQTIDALSQSHRRYEVREPISMEEMQQYVSRITTPFLMMTTMVLFMSILIIYTSFKVITMERLPIIGTFRSIGATRKMTDMVLIFESIMYGILGGLLGCGLGLGILYIMTYIMSENPWTGVRMKTSIQFTAGQLLGAFLLALILSFISSILPIIKISKIPVKDIVLGKFEARDNKKPWRFRVGICFLLIALFGPRLAPRSLGLIIGSLCLILSGTAVTFLVPYITNGFIRFFERLYLYIFGNEGILAAKNLRDNRSILNNISLLSVGISSLLMVNTISYSVVTELTSFYKEADFQIWMWVPQGSRSTDQLIRTIDGVEDMYGIVGTQNIEIADTRHKINLLHGVDKNKYLDYWNVDLIEENLYELDQGRNILLTQTLKDKFGVQVGDVLPLKMGKGERSYRVIGIFHSLRWNGNYALISDRYLKTDTGQVYYDNIYVKTNKEPEEVKNALKKKFARNWPWVETVAQMEDNEQKSNSQLFTILNGFSLLTLVIGIFGVMNNLVISFIERKRSLAVFRSIGMSKKQTIKMIFIEAFTGGLIGGTVGILTGLFQISIMPSILKAMDTPIPMHYSWKLFMYSVLAGIIIKVVASISPAMRSSKMNIVESIKYE